MSSKIRRRNRNLSEELNDRKFLKVDKKSNQQVMSLSNLINRFITLFKWIITIIMIIFIASPVVFRSSTTIQRMLIFMNYVNFPLNKNLSDPQNSFQMNCTTNLYLDTDDGMRLGIWHILPSSRSRDCLITHNSGSITFDDNRPIILYLHGNGGARGGHHRRQLYNLLTNDKRVDSHVVTFDYRGYGDSTNVWPTAEGMTSDAIHVYKWLISQKGVDRKRVIVWAHSLGSAITIRFVSQLSTSDNPRAIILEAPFSTISDAIRWYPLSIFFRYLPFFEWFFVEPITQNEVTNFDTISLLNKTSVPLLILHAIDDGMVPFHLGHKLYEQALKDQPKSCRKAQMIAFNSEYGYGHKNIYKDPELPRIIQTYIKSTESL